LAGVVEVEDVSPDPGLAFSGDFWRDDGDSYLAPGGRVSEGELVLMIFWDIGVKGSGTWEEHIALVSAIVDEVLMNAIEPSLADEGVTQRVWVNEVTIQRGGSGLRERGVRVDEKEVNVMSRTIVRRELLDGLIVDDDIGAFGL